MPAATQNTQQPTVAEAKPRPIRWLLFPLVLGVLLGLGYYLFLYVPSREQYFTESAFRRLAVLSEQIENLIAALASAIENGAATNNWYETSKQVQPLDWCEDMPRDCPTPAGTSICVSWGGGEAEASSTRLSSDAPLWTNPTVHRSARVYFAFRWQPTSTASPSPTPTQRSPEAAPRGAGQGSDGRAAAGTGVGHEQATPNAGLTCAMTPSPTPNQAALCASADLGQLLKPLMGGTAFDDFDVFLASADGTILFERGRSGLRLVKLPVGGQQNGGTLNAAPKSSGGGRDTGAAEVMQGLPSINALQSASALKPVSLSQVTYHLFTQPVRLAVPAHVSHGTDKPDGSTNQEQPVWVLGALIAQSQFATQSRTISFAVMSYVPLVVILILLALPVLKVWAMGPRDRLRTRDVYVLSACLVAGVAVLTVLVLSVYAYRQLVEDSDQRTEKFAKKLSGNFHEEVVEAYDALAEFVAVEAQPKATTLAHQEEVLEKALLCYRHDPAAGGQKLCEAQRRLAELKANWAEGKTWVLSGNDEAVRPLSQAFKAYPFFELLTWSDPHGQQQEKWTIRNVTTNLIRVWDLASFQDPFSERLWSFTKNCDPYAEEGSLECPQRRLALHSQISANTGALVPTLSVPIRHAEKPAILGVASMLTQWGALLYPLRAPDLGFAVIQNDGAVLFHSDPDRNLRENLFDESEPDRALRAAVFARRADFLNVDYNGRPERLYVYPIKDTAWTLVVFRDKELLRTVHLEMIVPCVLLCLVYAGLYILAAVAVRLLWPDDRGGWLWPTQRRAGAYLQCSGILLLVIAVSVATMWSCCPPGAVVASIMVALASAAYAFLRLSDRRTSPALLRVLGYGLLSTAGAAVIGLTCTSGPSAVSIAWIALALLMALSLVHDVTGRIAIQSRALLTYGYLGMGMLLLVVVAVLPAVALFRDAYRQATEAFVRLRQLQHAEARAERVRWLRDNYELYLTPDLFKERLDRTTDNAVTDNDLVSVAQPLKDQDQRSLCASLPQGVTGLVMARFPVYSRESQQLRELVYDRANDNRWQWGADRSQGVATLSLSDDRFRTVGDSPCLRGGRCIVQAVIPALSMPSWPIACVLIGALLIVLVLGFVALHALARAIFGLHVQGEMTPGDSASLLTSCLVLQPARQLVEQLKESSAVIDFHTDDPSKWRDWLATRVAGSPQRIVVDHFEYRIDEPSWARGKLELLEELVLNRSPIVTIASGWGTPGPMPLGVRREGIPVVVASEVDPLPHFARRLRGTAGGHGESLTADELSRWAHVCALLGKIRAEHTDARFLSAENLAPILFAECAWTEELRGIAVAICLDRSWHHRSRDALIEYIGDLANAHYRGLWAQCTEEERLVLIHLAAEGFVNPRSWDIVRQLMQRNLIRREGAFRLMNESLRRFVLAAEPPEQVTQWEKAGGASLWAQWRTALLLLLVAGGVFLFVTQPDRLNTWLGFLGALAGGLATLSQLFGVFQQGKGESPK